jgi:hypothetical protein
MADAKNAQKAIELAIDLYESKIAEKTISASEMGAYLKLLEKKGWDRELAQPSDNPVVNNLPFDADDGDTNVISMPRAR